MKRLILVCLLSLLFLVSCRGDGGGENTGSTFVNVDASGINSEVNVNTTSETANGEGVVEGDNIDNSTSTEETLITQMASGVSTDSDRSLLCRDCCGGSANGLSEASCFEAFSCTLLDLQGTSCG